MDAISFTSDCCSTQLVSFSNTISSGFSWVISWSTSLCPFINASNLLGSPVFFNLCKVFIPRIYLKTDNNQLLAGVDDKHQKKAPGKVKSLYKFFLGFSLKLSTLPVFYI